ncbi:microsomal glutathione S-transferase 1-like [Haliotis rufescens]|uniref:microsomal glutathione S-transferase 1-like n=1 Tax=Haliotis rufescens TaxID=6454 RepID=UPI001EAFACE4|nr:microsomal glutathione S-transferase 1-like [Haliotis rufescens]
MASPFSLDNPVFSKFAFYSTVVLSKTLCMGELTALYRTRRQAFANEEDVALFARSKHTEATTTDVSVERVRRCHLNDLENVLPFVLVGLMYVSTKPGATEATRVFQIFAASRLLHTVAYLLPLPQPTRAATYLTGYGATFFMVYKIIKAIY